MLADIKLKPPRSHREMLMMFALFNPEQGIDALLDQIEWSSVTRHQIYHSVLGRPPESVKVAIPPEGYSPRRHAQAAVSSAEFQHRIRELLLGAFPEKRRVVFVHIPKTAGTDISEALRRRFPWLEYHHSIPAMCDQKRLFAEIRDFVLAASLSDTVAITGHERLRWYRERELLRFGDMPFTIIRDPKSIILSYVNFIVNRFVKFRGIERADTRQWMKHLELDEFPEHPSQRYLAELAGKMIRTPMVTSPNMICTFLGSGTADSARDAVAVTDIEIVHLRNYQKWRAQKWSIDKNFAPNTSDKIISETLLSPMDREFMAQITEEDYKLYALIEKKLERDGLLSIRGSELA
ncbi:MAG: hypothetical protein JO047_14595 [Alphaproteobacteria bacterium]|nr:hypothetical protein [Alphaproteobacteria bacterium]